MGIDSGGTAQAPPGSILYQLVAAKLGTDPLDFIKAGRDAGKPFRIIAQELAATTKVDVTYEAVRRWWRSTPQGQKELDDTEEAAS